MFAILPSVNEKYCALFGSMNTYFTGEHDRVLLEVGGQSIVIDAESGLVLPPKHVTELDRLSYVVRTIDHDCHAIPRMSYKFTPLKETRKNEAFKGLSPDQALDINNW